MLHAMATLLFVPAVLFLIALTLTMPPALVVPLVLLAVALA